MQSFLLTLIFCAAPADVAVVCPEDFREAFAPWLAHRQAQGYRPVLLDNQGSADAILADILRLASQGPLRGVVLVGDALADGQHDADRRRLSTPTHHVPARVNVHWGSEPEIATDNPYGDLDGDGVPEIPVGRLSVRDARQLEVLVRKIIDYETCTDHGAWRRQINLVAGVGGFGPLADAVLELATRRLLTDGIPDSYETTMTHANWQSPFCPDPRRFRDVALARLNEGCKFWVYIGHGHKQRLDAVHLPGAAYPILAAADVAYLRAERGLPIALMLACYTGAFDLPQDCLAELMLRQPGGPVAVISGSRVTMPYAMAVMSAALMDQVFQGQARTLGEAFCLAKQRMAQTQAEDPHRQLLDALAAVVSPMPDRLEDERHEHLALFNLLGDPLLTLRRPAAVALEAPDAITAGQTLTVQGLSGISGSGMVEIASRRDRSKHELAPRRHFQWSDEFLRSMDDAYQQANDRVWVREPFQAHGGSFALHVDLPPGIRGPCYVRVWIENSQGAAEGATRIFVHPAPPQVGGE
jgi:hypothetical protein